MVSPDLDISGMCTGFRSVCVLKPAWWRLWPVSTGDRPPHSCIGLFTAILGDPAGL